MISSLGVINVNNKTKRGMETPHAGEVATHCVLVIRAVPRRHGLGSPGYDQFVTGPSLYISQAKSYYVEHTLCDVLVRTVLSN